MSGAEITASAGAGADAATVAWELWKDSDNDGANGDYAQDTLVGGACNSGPRQYTAAQMTAGKYYVKARGTSAARGVYYASVRDDDSIGSLECADGLGGGGATIARTLANGNRLTSGYYYVGLASQSNNGGTYTLTFDDGTGAVNNGADLMGCTAGAIESDVVAGRDYFVVVKGAGSTSGTYTLNVTDVGAVPDTTCGGVSADRAAPDSYVDFNVTDSAGDKQNVSIDLGGTLDAVYQLVDVTGATCIGGAGCVNSSGAACTGANCIVACSDKGGAGLNKLTASLATGQYRVKVKGKATAAGAGNATFNVAIRDDDGVGALECDNGTAAVGDQAVLTLAGAKRLGSGTYRVGITGQGAASGNYKVAFRKPGTNPTGATQVACAAGHVDAAVVANRPYYVLVKGNATGTAGTYGLAITDIGKVNTANAPLNLCGVNPAAPDAFFEFDVTDAGGDGQNVEIDLKNSSTLNAAFQLYRDVAGTPAVLTDDTAVGACNLTSAGPATYTLTAGKYYVKVKGLATAAGAGQQPFTLTIRDSDSVGAVACGTSSGGSKASLYRSLAPGVYRAGVTGKSGSTPTKGAFSLSVRGGGGAAIGATRIGCSQAGFVDVPLQSGKEYYAIVKGVAAASSGTYTLSLADLSAVTTSMGCGADNSAPDAYYYFDVNDAAGRTVAVDMANSTLAGAYELFNPDGTSRGCGVGATSRSYTLPKADNYFVAVRGTSTAAGGAEKPYEISIRDAAVSQAISCDYGAASGASVVDTLLGPGNYVVGVTGNSNSGGPTSGTYRATFEDKNITGTGATFLGCSATELEQDVIGGKPYYVIVKGTPGANPAYTLHVDDVGAVPDMSCNGTAASDSAPDSYAAFSVTGTKDVTVDMSGSTLSSVFELWRDNGAVDTKIGCATSAGAANSIASQLTAGNYYLKARGVSAYNGAGLQPLQFSVRDDDVQRATNCNNGAANAVGATITKALPAGAYYAAIRPQVGQTPGAYRLSVRDTALNAVGGTERACTTGNTTDVTVGANKDYYVLVKGETAASKGTFGLTVTDIGAIDPNTGSLFDTRTDIGCGADLAAADAFYEFTVAGASPTKNVEVALTNSFNGAYQLYRDDGAFTVDDAIATCQTATHSYALGNGKYFVVVKGRSVAAGAAEQPIQISIRDADAIGALACADGDSGTPATIRTTDLPASALDAQGRLLAGTYYLAFSGQAANGPYEVMFFDQDLIGGTAATVDQCSTNQTMTATLKPATDYYVVVKGNGPPNQGPFTLTMTDVSNVKPIDSMCPTDLSAPDGYAAFTLTNTRNVRIDMSGSLFTGAFQVFDNAGASVAGCGCSSLATPITCSLATGTYYVVYRGDNVAAGAANKPFNLVLQDRDALGSEVCADGAVATGNLIQKSLGAGTYYVGIVPRAGNVSAATNYSLTFKDQATAVVSGAPEIACSETELNANVNANQPYYVVVKGKNDADQGAYGLTVQDLTGVPAFGCGDDTSEGDAFYSFEVTDPAGSDVTIDSLGSSLQTVLAVFPENANLSKDWKNNSSNVCCNPGTPATNCQSTTTCDGKPDDMLACDSASGPMGTSLINNLHLAQGSYYVVVRARQGAPNAKLPFNISVRDAGSLIASSCDATDATDGQARIRQVLQPGTYWAALSDAPGASGTRNYKMRFRDYAPFASAATEVACNTASDTINYTVPPDHVGKPYYVVVKGDTAVDQAPYKLTVENLQLATGMGCNADNQSPDAFYRFSLATQATVAIDTVGSTLDTVIAIYPVSASYFGTNYAEDASGATTNCNDNGGGGTASRIQATLAAGDYYVVVKGAVGSGAAYGTNSKPFTVSIRDLASSASIACAPVTSSKITQTLPAGDYKLVVSDDGAGGNYDVKFRNLSVGSNSATLVGCNDAIDTVDYNIDAAHVGKPFYVVVKGNGTGASAKGAYSMTVESADQNGATMGCGAAKTSPDAFFKFAVTHQADVTIDTAGSDLLGGLDTVLAIYPGNATVFGTNYAVDAFGDQIGCNNDAVGLGTDSKISATLAAGTYYAVVKGANSGIGQADRPFNISIRDDGVTRALTCANSSSGASITRTLDPGNYVVVLSDLDAKGAANSGGAYSVTFTDLAAAAQPSGVQLGCALNTLDGGDANLDGKVDGIQVDAGQDYYVVVKGDSVADAANYTMTVEDVISSQAAAGSTPIACAAEGSAINATYPAGDYYAVVSGAANKNGAYELKVEDADPFADYNRIACDADSGPNGTSVIEADLQPGTHYVVVKGDGPGQSGTYQLNVRDTDARKDNRVACADTDDQERLTYNVKAGQDYTVLLKGDEKLAQGAFDLKLYDELGLQSSGGSRLACQTVCPDVGPYNSTGSSQFCCKSPKAGCSKATDCCSGSCKSGKCEDVLPSFTQSLTPDTYYLSVKGRRATEKGFFELQVGDPQKGANISKFVPPVWNEVKDALVQSGVKVLPVLSCAAGSNNGRCDGATAQAEAIAKLTGVMSTKTGTQGLVQRIKNDGTGLGSGLALAVRDLANYLAMDISLTVADNPGFQIDIQKCTNPSDLAQKAVCTHFTTGCTDPAPNPKNTIAACQPGAEPKFFVNFTNPSDPNAVPPNPSDPNGGYHFKLRIVGKQQYTLEEIPVYIIPTNKSVMAPPPPGAGTYQTMGTYEQQVFGSGCNYYQIEGEGTSKDSCKDGINNNPMMGPGIDKGLDLNMDGDFNDPGEYPPDPGCLPGSCMDGVNNDGDKSGSTELADLRDPDCATTVSQDWTDLYFKADVPAGTSIDFDMCTATTQAGLASCTYSRVATVSSSASSSSCTTLADCKAPPGSTAGDGFCGTGGQCQYIAPAKLGIICSSNADCASLNGPLNGEQIATYCNTQKGQCQYITPPAEIGDNLLDGQNGNPFAKLRVTLNADPAASKSPTLFEWNLQYVCRPLN